MSKYKIKIKLVEGKRKYYYELFSSNGVSLVTSKLYNSKYSVYNSILSLKKIALSSEVEEDFDLK